MFGLAVYGATVLHPPLSMTVQMQIFVMSQVWHCTVHACVVQGWLHSAGVVQQKTFFPAVAVSVGGLHMPAHAPLALSGVLLCVASVTFTSFITNRAPSVARATVLGFAACLYIRMSPLTMGQSLLLSLRFAGLFTFLSIKDVHTTACHPAANGVAVSVWCSLLGLCWCSKNGHPGSLLPCHPRSSSFLALVEGLACCVVGARRARLQNFG